MQDPRYDKLAEVIVRHSTKLSAGEKVLIDAIDVPSEITIALLRACRQVGAVPLISIKQNVILRELYRLGDQTMLAAIGQYEAGRMADMQAYVGLRGSHNATELSDVPDDKMKLYQEHWWKPVHLEIRVPKTKWVVLRWPHPGMAQQAEMSTEAFENFYFNVCTLDYTRMSKAMDALVQRMQNTDTVHIVGPGTDLRFSIKGIPVIKCSGEYNLPDGEVFTAPVRDSVNGQIRFSARTIYQGITHENVELVFDQGKIIEARSDKPAELNKVLDTDQGARYIGEFALGVNPYITRPMLDILFDEKIGGSFHFTPGNSYDNASNDNHSKVHWDLVSIQTPEYGGGQIYFDGELVRKDGLFVTKELRGLNPEHLK